MDYLFVMESRLFRHWETKTNLLVKWVLFVVAYQGDEANKLGSSNHEKTTILLDVTVLSPIQS